MSAFAKGADRRKLIAKVHVAKKQLGLDDAVYRAVLLRVTGAESSRDLSVTQLESVVSEFRRLGWGPKTAKGKRPSGNPQVRMIWALWTELGKLGLIRSATRPALRTFVHNRTGITDPEWLSVEQASAVIQALQAWKKGLASKKEGAE